MEVCLKTNIDLPYDSAIPLVGIYPEKTIIQKNASTSMFQTGKGVHQGCILLLCLLNLHAEHIMQNARLEEVHVGITISVRNVSDLKIHR